MCDPVDDAQAKAMRENMKKQGPLQQLRWPEPADHWKADPIARATSACESGANKKSSDSKTSNSGTRAWQEAGVFESQLAITES